MRLFSLPVLRQKKRLAWVAFPSSVSRFGPRAEAAPGGFSPRIEQLATGQNGTIGFDPQPIQFGPSQKPVCPGRVGTNWEPMNTRLNNSVSSTVSIQCCILLPSTIARSINDRRNSNPAWRDYWGVWSCNLVISSHCLPAVFP